MTLKPWATVAGSLFSASCAVATTLPGSAHIESPEQYQLLLESDSIEVLKMVLKPGEADLWHTHRDETVYFEKGGDLLIRQKGADDFRVSVPDGHVMWHQSWTHQVTNMGTKEVIAIIVESKK